MTEFQCAGVRSKAAPKSSHSVSDEANASGNPNVLDVLSKYQHQISIFFVLNLYVLKRLKW